MLNRQRLILALLCAAKEPVSPTALVKYAFLLRSETEVGADATFYAFVPYRFGPFSFALYRELATLERDGYVRRAEKAISLNHELLDLTRREVDRLSRKQIDAAQGVVARYGRLAHRSLLRSVYDRYPWYATASELEDLIPANSPGPKQSPIAVYTAGYEGQSIDSFCDALLRSGLRALIDVRANPISRKYGFAKRSLQRISDDLGLGYHHLPQLGIASERRAGLGSTASYQRLLDEYEREMLPRQRDGLLRAIELLREKPSALLCVERDVRCCHRSRLAQRIASESGLEVVHL